MFSSTYYVRVDSTLYTHARHVSEIAAITESINVRAIWIGEGVAYTDVLSESTVGYTFKAQRYSHFPRGRS